MLRVSSNLTIFFKLFLPTVWIVFFGIFTIAIFLAEDTQIPLLTSPFFKYSFLAFYLIFFILIYFSLMKLKRVELGEDSYIVSNYFKTFRLYYNDVSNIDIIPLGRLKVITFHLKNKASFGKKITFLASSYLWNYFLEHNPVVKAKFESLISQ